VYKDINNFELIMMSTASISEPPLFLVENGRFSSWESRARLVAIPIKPTKRAYRDGGIVSHFLAMNDFPFQVEGKKRIYFPAFRRL
jgi:hypothetical protein